MPDVQVARHALPSPAWRLLDDPRTAHSPTEAVKTASDEAPGAERWLLCAGCNARVAREEDRIEVFGSHAHTRMNPFGALYRFGCFAAAPGAMEVTQPSSEFPWFAGYSWQITVCRTCHRHLGWTFTGPSHFVGLVLDFLTS